MLNILTPPLIPSTTIKQSIEINNLSNLNDLPSSTSTSNSDVLPNSSFFESSNHSWCSCHHSNFLLRSGQNYQRNQEKSPSPPPIMDLIGVDIVRCEKRIDHFTAFIQLHQQWLQSNIENNQIPSLFIINTQVILILFILLFLSVFLSLFISLFRSF